MIEVDKVVPRDYSYNVSSQSSSNNQVYNYQNIIRLNSNNSNSLRAGEFKMNFIQFKDPYDLLKIYNAIDSNNNMIDSKDNGKNKLLSEKLSSN